MCGVFCGVVLSPCQACTVCSEQDHGVERLKSFHLEDYMMCELADGISGVQQAQTGTDCMKIIEVTHFK